MRSIEQMHDAARDLWQKDASAHHVPLLAAGGGFGTVTLLAVLLFASGSPVSQTAEASTPASEPAAQVAIIDHTATAAQTDCGHRAWPCATNSRVVRIITPGHTSPSPEALAKARLTAADQHNAAARQHQTHVQAVAENAKIQRAAKLASMRHTADGNAALQRRRATGVAVTTYDFPDGRRVTVTRGARNGSAQMRFADDGSAPWRAYAPQ